MAFRVNNGAPSTQRRILDEAVGERRACWLWGVRLAAICCPGLVVQVPIGLYFASAPCSWLKTVALYFQRGAARIPDA